MPTFEDFMRDDTNFVYVIQNAKTGQVVYIAHNYDDALYKAAELEYYEDDTIFCSAYRYNFVAHFNSDLFQLNGYFYTIRKVMVH